MTTLAYDIRGRFDAEIWASATTEKKIKDASGAATRCANIFVFDNLTLQVVGRKKLDKAAKTFNRIVVFGLYD